MRALTLALLTLPFTASAFCGFYVSGAGGKLFNDASSVVLVRDGTHTVLSMQNNYRGPVEDFAMVVPVPVVLTKDAVKTLPRAAFMRIDELSSPRLVAMPKVDCRPRGLGLGGLGTRGSGSGTGAGVWTGRERRGEVLGRGIRRRHPLGEVLGRPRDLAQGEQVPGARRRRGAAAAPCWG